VRYKTSTDRPFYNPVKKRREKLRKLINVPVTTNKQKINRNIQTHPPSHLRTPQDAMIARGWNKQNIKATLTPLTPLLTPQV
jgi:hypothetical protein